MAEPVCEIRTIAGLLDNAPGYTVDLGELHTRTNCTLCRLLCAQHSLIDLPMLLTYLSEEKGPCHIRTITILLASHIKEYAVSFLQNRRIRLMMSICRISTKTDKRIKGVSFRTK